MSESELTTHLLARIRAGDAQAREELLPRIYSELHGLAGYLMKGKGPDHTLQPTALVNEAYIRMTGGTKSDWESRTHFIGVAAKAMRSALVDHARKRQASKRGNAWERVHFDAITHVFEERVPDLIALDEALERLAEFSAEAAQVVELRFFAGLEHEEVARVLGLSERTVRRHWQTARLWLLRELED